MAAAMLVASGGCSALDRTAALDPETLAPPSAASSWTPPTALAVATPAVAAPVPADADPTRVWDLPALIDLGLASSPDTRAAWQRTRAAAAAFGTAQAAWLPVLALTGRGGWSQALYPAPTGLEIARVAELTPRAELSWLLVDFGRRDAERERARQELAAAGYTFTREQQAVAYAVQRAFYVLAARRAAIGAAEAASTSANATYEQTLALHERGLATRPDVLLAYQDQARAAFDLEDARGRADDAWADLATALGIPPTTRLQVVPLDQIPLPSALPEAVDAVIDAALAQRPDLVARLATVRARAADLARAEADYWPRVGVTGSVGGMIQSFRAGPPFKRTYHEQDPMYGAFLGVEWKLFEGFARDNAVREARAQVGVAEADLDARALSAMREVWTAYVDVRTALRKLGFAEALLAASRNAYDATRESYRQGLGTLIDLLAAERDLDRSRVVQIETRTEVLMAAAALTFATGNAP
ncbi:MAG: TolC family protein [bacterium]|nr:TolC family protein [bacterium]